MVSPTLTKQGGNITISADGPVRSGSLVCFSVFRDGETTAAPTVSVEINGVVVPASHVTVTADATGSGALSVCVWVPSTARGGSLTIIVVDGGAAASRDFSIH